MDEFGLIQAQVPEICSWIDRTLSAHAEKTKPLSSYGFQRLNGFFPEAFLAGVKVVETEALPRPPLRAMGLEFLGDFETMPISAITYRSTYFIRPEAAKDEALHCHEIVHVAQWEYLRDERFLMNYGLGLLDFGYKNHPMETMAQLLEGECRRGRKKTYDMRSWVWDKLNSRPWIFVR